MREKLKRKNLKKQNKYDRFLKYIEIANESRNKILKWREKRLLDELDYYKGRHYVQHKKKKEKEGEIKRQIQEEIIIFDDTDNGWDSLAEKWWEMLSKLESQIKEEMKKDKVYGHFC